jgi:hypothetical protein
MKTTKDEFVFPRRESGARSGAATGHGDLCATQPASELAGAYQLSLRDKTFAVLSHTRSRHRKLAAALRLSPTRFVAAMSDVWRRGPGGTTDNSPAFQRRVRATNHPRPVGTPELAVVVPSTSVLGMPPHFSAKFLAFGLSENSNREIRRRSRRSSSLLKRGRSGDLYLLADFVSALDAGRGGLGGVGVYCAG